MAKTLTGREVVVSRWDAHRQQYIANRYGVAYFNVFKVQFNVNVPAFRIVRSRTAPYRLLRCTPFVNEWLVLDEPELLTHIGAEVANFRYVSANATLDQQHQWIRNAFNAYIADLPTEDGFAILTSFFDSDTGFAYDTSRQPTFDEQVTHVHRPGPTATELILNRPLQGIVIVPEDMYAKTGIHPIAWSEGGQGRDNCVLNQLVVAITMRQDRRTRGPNGEKITEPGSRFNKPKYTILN